MIHSAQHQLSNKPFMRFHLNSWHIRISHGMTLLEMLLCMFIISLIAVSTATVLGNGRVLREKAKHRAELALLAQSKLDRLRSKPLAQLAEGQQMVHHDEWPASVSIVETIRKRNDGFLELNISADRKSPGGDLKVVLTSIHPGGRR